MPRLPRALRGGARGALAGSREPAEASGDPHGGGRAQGPAGGLRQVPGLFLPHGDLRLPRPALVNLPERLERRLEELEEGAASIKAFRLVGAEVLDGWNHAVAEMGFDPGLHRPAREEPRGDGERLIPGHETCSIPW